ncbi:MAG: hydroxymethylglutaryl-CoA synthase family protein [Spirochaetaceae bacterium]
MTETSVGLSDLFVYVPSPRISLEALVDYRVKSAPSLERRLRRALETTGQRAVRYPRLYEDNVTLSSEAAAGLLRARGSGEGLRYLAVGTETPVDHSKPVAAYVEGVLQNAGMEIPETISTFQVQHACAGGTISMLSVGALLAVGGRSNESGIVISSDIARYDAPSTAEITQGAGAVAMLVETSPRLLSLDLQTIGYSSRDVDDFFRPLGSVTAKVKGGYSVQCYNDAFEVALSDHASRSGMQPGDVLRHADYIALHVPFYKMPITALRRSLLHHNGLPEAEADAFLQERGVFDALEPTREVGNIYSGSAYLSLAFMLKQQHEKLGDGIVGKRVLIGSYGSGNTMSVFSGTIADGAPELIARWNLDAVLSGGVDESLEHYERWLRVPMSSEEYHREMASEQVPEGRFYLENVRDDGYREYTRA